MKTTKSMIKSRTKSRNMKKTKSMIKSRTKLKNMKKTKSMKGNGKRKYSSESDSDNEDVDDKIYKISDDYHSDEEVPSYEEAPSYDSYSDHSDEEIPSYETSFSEDVFIHLGKTHIMGDIDWVSYSALLNKDGCNIFIMAESHNPRHYQCTGILEMFKNLLHDWSTIKPTFPIDLMIEMPQTEYTKHTLRNTKDYSLSELHNLIDNSIETERQQYTKVQMHHVRNFFGLCANKNCKPLKVHWIDSAGIIDDKITESIETPTVRTEIPWWIYQLDSYMYDGIGEDGFTDVQLTNLYVDKENTIPFKLINDEDLIKLLIDHPIIRKEIRKSPLSLDFAVNFIQTIIDKPYDTFGLKVLYVWRATMDVYTVARILYHQMKNVIIYVGWNHADNLCNMFQQLGFTIDKKQGSPKCNYTFTTNKN